MRMDRLTTSLQNALAESQSLALGQDHNQIDTVHVLLALWNKPVALLRMLFAALALMCRNLNVRYVQ